MDLKDIDLRMWWIALILFGVSVIIGALAAKERDWALIGLGAAVCGFGEWAQRPLHTDFCPGWQITSYPRQFNVVGALLDLVGVILILVGLYRVLWS